MTRIVGVGLLFLGLALGAPARAADVDKLLPDDSEVVVGINIRQVLDSALIKKFGLDAAKEALKGEAEAQKVLSELGFDPFKDLDSVIVVGPGGGSEDRGLMIVQGRFDQAKFRAKAEEAVKKKGDLLKVEKDGPYTLYQLTIPEGLLNFGPIAPPQATKPFYIGLADSSTILIGQPKEYVREALDKNAGKREAALKNKTIQDLLAKVDRKQSLWMIVPGSALPKDLPIDDEKLKKTVQGIDAITGGINVTDEVKIKFHVAVKDSDSAKGLVMTIKDGVNKARLFLAIGGPQLAPLGDVLSSIKTTAKDKVVTLDCTITADVIEKLNQGQ